MVNLRNASILTISSLGLFLSVGCASRHKAIPESATLVAADQGNIDFVAPDDGRVYIEDKTANKLLYSGQVRQGQHVNVEPTKDRIAVDGQMVRDQKIRDLDNLRVFFQRDPRSADVAGSHTTVVAPTVVQPSQASETTRTEIRDSRDTRDSQILVTPKGDNQSEIRVRPGANADSKITVEPGQDGSNPKVTVEHEPK